MKEEEKTNDNGNQNGENGNHGSGGNENGQDSGAPSGQSGGESGASGKEERPSGGEGGGGNGGGESGGRGEGNDAKTNLLQRIRNNRAKGQHEPSGSTDGTSPRDSEGKRKNDRGNKRGNEDDARSSSGTNRDHGRMLSKNDNVDGGARETSQTNESGRIKPTGVNIKGADKIKALAQAATQNAAPKVRFTWDDKPLSNKEGDEIQPKIKALLEFVFRHFDKGISVTNRSRNEAHIWSTIDDEDLDIIAGHLVEMGKASRIVATAVRRMTNSYRLLQIGLISLPKFLQTYQFYATNGGFALIPGKGGH